MSADRPPPIFDVDLEQACIGAFLTDPLTIPVAMARCLPSDFYDPLHERLVAMIFQENEAGKVSTPLTVANRLRGDPGLEEVGGRAYLISLARSCPAMPNVADYSIIIAEMADKRAAQRGAEEALELLAGQATVEQALAPLIQVNDLSQQRKATLGDSSSAGEAGQILLMELERGQERPEGMHAPTGLSALDEVIGGLYPATLTIAGGRPGMGKSILGQTFCRAAAQAGWAPHMFSLEMSRRENAARLLTDLDYETAIERGSKPLEYSRLLHHKPMSDREWERAILARGEAETLSIEINDRDSLTWRQIASLARARAQRLRKPTLVVVDHMHIIEGEDSRDRRIDQLTQITKGAKQLAKRANIPVILLAQLNRGVEGRDDKMPMLSDFRESGSIEQDADIIMGLLRPAYYARAMIRAAKTDEQLSRAHTLAFQQANLLQIGILKNRNGPTDELSVFIDVASAAIRGADPAKPKPDGPQGSLGLDPLANAFPEQRG